MTSTPGGASVMVDGQAFGITPAAKVFEVSVRPDWRRGLGRALLVRDRRVATPRRCCGTRA
ncbi:MAG: hypothetical protein ACR2IK_02915 [Chloroflexota bacterium]